MSRLITVAESAAQLGLKPKTLRFWIWTRKIEYVKVGRAVRLRQETIQKLIEEGSVPAK